MEGLSWLTFERKQEEKKVPLVAKVYTAKTKSIFVGLNLYSDLYELQQFDILGRVCPTLKFTGTKRKLKPLGGLWTFPLDLCVVFKGSSSSQDFSLAQTEVTNLTDVLLLSQRLFCCLSFGSLCCKNNKIKVESFFCPQMSWYVCWPLDVFNQHLKICVLSPFVFSPFLSLFSVLIRCGKLFYCLCLNAN